MALLQKLLSGRAEAVIFYKDRSWCSCGQTFDDYNDLENHIVTHPKIERSGPSLDQAIKDLLSNLRKILAHKGETLEPSLYFPEKTFIVLPEESDLNSGHLKCEKCVECLIEFSDFGKLKDHYTKCHPKRWKPTFTENQIKFVVLGARPEKVAGWVYQFHCPIPGCKYHVLSSKRGAFKNSNLLKQHYFKVHVKSSQNNDPVCSFSCGDCSQSFKWQESLRTHCRRKGHSYQIKRIPKFKPTQVTALLDKNGFIKIAPRPPEAVTGQPTCPVQLSAAIALSQLGEEEVLAGRRTEDVLLSAYASTTTTTRTVGVGSPVGGPRKVPRLGDIEQFSTETQTDELEQLMVRAAGAEDLMKSIEANSQYELDDILCSNYTQTYPDEEGMLMVPPLIAENKLNFGPSKPLKSSSVGTHIDLGPLPKIIKKRGPQGPLSNMETQTPGNF